ncbi:MAG: TetR/AcrR family transcriptional regulator [Solirubrobacterales bacterium]
MAYQNVEETKSSAPGTRRRILRATFELIGKDGIAAVSNRRVATAAGVSLGSLTYHFPSHEELLRESLCLFVDEEVERMEAAAAELHARRSEIGEVAREVRRFAAESVVRPQRKAELELHLRASRDPALQEASRRCFSAYEDMAAAILASLGVPEPERHGRTVVALIGGLGVQWLGSGTSDPSGLLSSLATVVQGALAEAAGGPAAANLQMG